MTLTGMRKTGCAFWRIHSVMNKDNYQVDQESSLKGVRAAIHESSKEIKLLANGSAYEITPKLEKPLGLFWEQSANDRSTAGPCPA